MPEGALKLRGPGLQIVRGCDGQTTLAEIVTTLQSQFPQADPKKVESDTAEFLEQLKNRRAVDFE
jgi:pyrroloquinoline quinone biosynthesis protein D